MLGGGAILPATEFLNVVLYFLGSNNSGLCVRNKGITLFSKERKTIRKVPNRNI